MNEDYVQIDYYSMLNEYLSENYKKPQEVTIDIDYFNKKCGMDIGEHIVTVWSKIVEEINIYFTSLDVTYSNIYPIFLKNYKNPVNVADLRNIHINTVVTLDGFVRKISESKEQIIKSKWQCPFCDGIFSEYGMKVKTSQCPHCKKSVKKFLLLPEQCAYQDIQWFVLQESQPLNGRQPKSISCLCRGSMIDKLQAGNRCTVTGRICVDIDEQHECATMWMDVLTCERSEDDYIDVVISEEDEKNIKELSQSPDLYQKLIDSVNPNIWGYNEIKLAMILQMAGGVSCTVNNTLVRGDSHILICGDPGMAKSKILKSVQKIVPRCIYTSGKSTSAAGLTVAAVRDENTGQWTLEAGALVLANGSLCIVDELDKMSNEDRSALHEAMEDQCISVAKAGINQTLKTECPLLCACNPKYGRFMNDLSLITQIDLPDSLKSRFDLIFMLVDEPNYDVDYKVAYHNIKVSNGIDDTDLEPAIPIDLLRKYIIYCKRIRPTISDDVNVHISKKYAENKRKSGQKMTMRQLEALRRLSQSFARIRLSPVVSKEDADKAISLYEYSLSTITLGNENVLIDSPDMTDYKHVLEIFNKMYKPGMIVNVNDWKELYEAVNMKYDMPQEVFNVQYFRLISDGLIINPGSDTM